MLKAYIHLDHEENDMKITTQQLRKIISEEIAKVTNLQEDEEMSDGKYYRGQIKDSFALAARNALKDAYDQALEDLATEVDPGEVEAAAAAAVHEIYNEFMDEIRDEIRKRGKFGSRY